ncbi:MAG TPA: ester cyclase [Thermomicrobiales bacterium]|nr:ester cyclase [Thermomicrobiales bacterium]
MAQWFRRVAGWPFWRNLRLRLVLLVILALLPSLILLYLTARDERIDAIQGGRDEATRIVRLVASDQQTITTQIGTVLGTLALNPNLEGDDPAACSALLTSLLDSGNQESEDTSLSTDVRVNGATIQQLTVMSGEGTVLCSGNRTSSSVDTPDPSIAVAAIERNRFVAGEQHPTQDGAVHADYAVPIPEDSSVGGIALIAVAEITALDSTAVTADVPDGTFIAVVDRSGTVLHQYPAESIPLENLTLAGTPVSRDVTQLQRMPLDEASPLDSDGRAYITAVDSTWAPGTDETTRINYVVAGIPEASVVLQADSKFNHNLGRLAIAGLVGLVAAWVGSDLIGGRDAGTRMGLVRDYYHLFETGQLDRLDQIIAPGYVDRSAAPGTSPGVEGLRQNIAAFRSAFPDGKIAVQDLMSDHDSVMARVMLSGTQVAPYAGIPPVNERVMADGVETFRFSHGMVIESWSLFGALRVREVSVAQLEEPEPPARASLLRGAWRRLPWGGS